jgi:hypothetical protein
VPMLLLLILNLDLIYQFLLHLFIEKKEIQLEIRN